MPGEQKYSISIWKYWQMKAKDFHRFWNHINHGSGLLWNTCSYVSLFKYINADINSLLPEF